MNKTDIFLTGAVFGVILLTFVNLFVGVYYKPTPISERITACEEKGGRYNYMWNEFTNGYFERCQLRSDEIKDF